MSIVNFSRQLASLSAQVQKNTQDLHEIRNEIEGVIGPMDELIQKAEEAGSAVANIGGQMAEMVSLNQDNWQPALEGVMWDMYRVTEKIEEVKTVSRDVLDAIAGKFEEFVPAYDLWTKHWLALAEQGKMTLDELEKNIEGWFNSPGIIQLNTVMHGDIPNFLLQFRQLMKEIRDGTKPMSDAADMLDEITGKAKNATKAIEEVRHSTGGMTSQGSGSTTSIGASSLGDPRNATDMAARIAASLDAAKRR